MQARGAGGDTRASASAASNAEVAARIGEHLQQYGAEASRLVDVFAERHSMHPTDLQALMVIMTAERNGSAATPGVLRQALHLTSGAVTGAVDRLVSAGHVRREVNALDRRQIFLVADESAWRVGSDFFGPLGESTDAITREFAPDELRVVEAFLAKVARAIADHRRDLQDR